MKKCILNGIKHSFGVRWGRWRWPLVLRNADRKLFSFFSGSRGETTSVFDMMGQARAHREVGSEISLAKGGDWGCVKAAHHYVCSKKYCSLHCLLLSKNLGKLRKRSPSTLNDTEESSACGFLGEALREMCHLAAAVEKACLYMLHESCALFSNADYVHSTILWCERIL